MKKTSENRLFLLAGIAIGATIIANSAVAGPAAMRPEDYAKISKGRPDIGEKREYRAPENRNNDNNGNQNRGNDNRNNQGQNVQLNRPPQQNNNPPNNPPNNNYADRNNGYNDNRNNDNRNYNNGTRNNGGYYNNGNNNYGRNDHNNQYRPPSYNNQYRPPVNNNRNDYNRYNNSPKRFEFSNRSGTNYWGPHGNWQRWNPSWGDANTYARRWGFDGYDANRGWRKGNKWYSHPSLWSNWGGWYSFFMSGNGIWGFSYANGYTPYSNYGNNCMRVQTRDWYNGGRAVISFMACEDRWGEWREVPNTREFEYWTY